MNIKPLKFDQNILVKVQATDRKAIDDKAVRHAKGNLSAWVRHSAKHYVPKKGEKIPLD